MMLPNRNNQPKPLACRPVSAMGHRRRSGFTLVESVVALGIAMVAATALTLGVTTAINNTESSLEYAIGLGMAEQMIDEALGLSYVVPGGDPYQTPLGPSAAEAAAPGRSLFNDTDDFEGFVASPPEDLWGQPLGKADGLGGLRHPNFYADEGYLDGWKQRVRVFYVDDTDPSIALGAGVSSSMRAIEVVIQRVAADGTEREVARARRVFSHIPTF